MIDKVPALPTDNLYKLGTLAGLFLALATPIGVPLNSWYTSDRLDKAGDEALKIVERRADGTLLEDRPTKLSPGMPLDAIMAERLNAIDNASASANRMLYILSGIGLAIFGVSITFWYRQYQRYQDMLLREELRKSRLENEKTELEVLKLRTEDDVDTGPAAPDGRLNGTVGPTPGNHQGRSG